MAGLIDDGAERTVETECPKCNRSYQVKESSIGRQAVCQNCSVQFTVTQKSVDPPPLLTNPVDGDEPFSGIETHRLKRNPLAEWGAYTVLMFLLLLLVTGRFFFNALVSDPTGMCLVILMLFCAGFAKSLWDTHVLQLERHALNEQVVELGRSESLDAFLAANEEGMFRDHLQNMVKISAHEPDFNQDNLIHLLHSRLHAKSGTTEILSSVLVSLGLIGTIAGLIQSTSGLSGVMSAINDAADGKMAEGLREVLGGMGLAFYTTLLGAILGSVILKVLNSVYTSNVDTFAAHLAEISEVYVVPRLRRQRREAVQ